MPDKPSRCSSPPEPATLRGMNRLPESEIESLRQQTKSDAMKVKQLQKMRGKKSPASSPSLLPAVHTYYEKYGDLLPMSGLKFVADNDLFSKVNSDFQKAIDSDKPLGDLSDYVQKLAKDLHRQRQEQSLSLKAE